MTQNMANHDSKELPLGVQHVLDDHSRIVQMMSQIVSSTNNSLPQDEHGEEPTKVDTEMICQACKRCGEVGHASKDCHEECPYCVLSHSIGKCPMTQVTCFLCEGTNHILAECKFYSTVLQDFSKLGRLKDAAIQGEDATKYDQPRSIYIRLLPVTNEGWTCKPNE
jgi:hypothetical protein